MQKKLYAIETKKISTKLIAIAIQVQWSNSKRPSVKVGIRNVIENVVLEFVSIIRFLFVIIENIKWKQIYFIVAYTM